MTASALMLRITATSVVKARDLILRPNTRMPEHSEIQVGILIMWLRRVPSYSGTHLRGAIFSVMGVLLCQQGNEA